MLFSKKKTYDVKKKSEKKEKEEKKKTVQNIFNFGKKTVQCTKVKLGVNPYCSKCPHRPPQSLTPKNENKYQKEKGYNKLYKIT